MRSGSEQTTLEALPQPRWRRAERWSSRVLLLCTSSSSFSSDLALASHSREVYPFSRVPCCDGHHLSGVMMITPRERMTEPSLSTDAAPPNSTNSLKVTKSTHLLVHTTSLEMSNSLLNLHRNFLLISHKKSADKTQGFLSFRALIRQTHFVSGAQESTCFSQ